MSESDSVPPTSAGQFLAALVGALIPVLIVILLLINHVAGLQGTIKLGPVDLGARPAMTAAAPPPTTPLAAEKTVQPAATPAVAAPAPKPAVTAAPEKGQAVYNTTCVACHAAGVAGAPKTGDRTAWGPRLSSGKEALYESALKGKGAMPPKGGNVSLTDADVMAAVDYLIAQVK